MEEVSSAMNSGYLCMLAFLFLALPLSSPAQSSQSLGDIARQLRSERQQSGAPHTKVITNDDIESRDRAHGRNAAKRTTNDAAQDEAEKHSEETAGVNSREGAKQETESSGEPKHAKASGKKEDAAKESEAQELETEKRTEEINKVYRDRIAAIRTQIYTAQQELATIQRDQIVSSNDFQRSYGTAPNVGAYDAQQRLFNEQIEAHRTSINTLNSQLEDAEEAARHAGVPHASD
jgi:hypothetical protein